MLLFSVLVLGCAVVLYSALFFDIPVPAWVSNSLAGLRLAFLLILLYLLINPFINEIVSTRLSPTLYIALDDSLSMSYPVNPVLDSENEPSRWESMITMLRNSGILDEWEDKGFQMQFGRFSEISQIDSGSGWSTSPLFNQESNAPHTDISAVIQSFKRKTQNSDSAYFMLFTDGQWTRGGSPASAAVDVMLERQQQGNSLDYRIYSFGIGTTDDLFDLVIESFNLPSDIRAGDSLTAEIAVAYRGEEPQIPVTLRLQGISQDQTVVYDETLPVNFGENASTILTIPLPDLPKGEYQFIADLSLLEQEILDANNIAKRGVRVRESQDRVLILTSAPAWDSKFLKRALEDHPSIEVQSYFIHDDGISFLGDPSTATDELPVMNSVEELQNSLPKWSVVVLANFYFRPDLQSFAKTLNDWLENGGGVLVLPGQYNSAPPSAAIEAVLPSVLKRVYVAIQQNFVVLPTDAESSPLLSQLDDELKQSLIPLSNWYRVIKPETNAVIGQTLLQGMAAGQQKFALLDITRVGLGRVVVGYTDTFWRWGMMSEQDILPVFWVSAVYQAQPRLLSTAGQIYIDRFTYSPYQPVQIKYSIRETIGSATAENLSLLVKHGEQEERVWLQSTLEQPNAFQGGFTPTDAGEYTIATIGGEAQTSFMVEASLEELRDLRQNIQALRDIASAGGGEYANQPAWKSLAENIPFSTKLKEETMRRFWGEKWWVVSLLVLLLGLEWFTRWRQGLP